MRKLKKIFEALSTFKHSPAKAIVDAWATVRRASVRRAAGQPGTEAIDDADALADALTLIDSVVAAVCAAAADGSESKDASEEQTKT